MATFRVSYGGDYEFEGQDVGEVVPVMYRHKWRNDFLCPDEGAYMRRTAIEMCEWNGGTYYYDSRSSFGASMVRNGLLERVSHMD
jgi:hypothetical protein|tara:strand:- start:619 stop:873 length:255 start_codon:yes stop_codon:yes gene_type:complete